MILHLLLLTYLVYLSIRDIKYQEIENELLLLLTFFVAYYAYSNSIFNDAAIVYSIVFVFFYLFSMIMVSLLNFINNNILKKKDGALFYLGEADIIVYASLSIFAINLENGVFEFLLYTIFVLTSFVSVSIVMLLSTKFKFEGLKSAFIPHIAFAFVVMIIIKQFNLFALGEL